VDDGAARAEVAGNRGARASLGLVRSVVLAVLALLAFTGSARGEVVGVAFGDQLVPVTSAPAEVAALTDEVTTWASATLGVELDDRRVLAAGAKVEHGRIAGFTNGVWIVLDPEVTRDLSHLAAGRCDPMDDARALRLLLHEVLHRIERGGPWWLEEGITDAVALDLYPSLWVRLCGRGGLGYPGVSYPTRAKWARAMSADLSGSGAWTRGARLTRRAILLADGPTREAMYHQAMAAR
jgi:hypothetical protein